MTLLAAMEGGLAPSQERRLGCAILLSCGLPWDYAALQVGESRRLSPDRDGCCIRTPTAHFWGSNDDEGFRGNHDVALLCDQSSRVEFVHSAGHGVPSGSKPRELDTVIAGVELTVQRAVHRPS